MQNLIMPQKPNHRLRELREISGLTQEKAAEHFGLSTSGYNKIERGDRRLTADHINRARRLYGHEAQIIPSDPANPNERNVVPLIGATQHNSGAINRELFIKILVMVDERRKIDKIRMGGKNPHSFGKWVADLYDLAQSKDGSFESIEHLFDFAPDDENDD